MGNQSYFLEGRAIEIESEDSELEFAVIVAQPTVITIGPIQELITRMALATFAGLAVALAIGYVVAERTARPLKSAAAAARRMATGERNIDVEVKGALEVADISEALNQLSSHLAHSENRQREFFMSVSHELRTPLTAMKAYGEALQDGVIPTSDLPRVGGVLVQETDRLTRLVSDLLELGRAQAVDFPLVESTCDVAELLSLAASSWKLRCQKEAIDFDFHSESIVMQTDPVRLRQIVDNLVENALRVTPDHGRIQLSVQSDSEDVLITVDDSGPGLADEDFAVAFEPAMLFSKYQGQRPVGTGLGLALVQRLVHRMGGTIHATHSPLGGARFVVRLPASQPGD
jgi:two-component system sensor histidine kinase BaeS